MQGVFHMVLLGLAVKVPWLGLGEPINTYPGCMDMLRKCYSHFVGGSFLAGKVALALSGCLTTESVDYCMSVNEWARLQVSLQKWSLKSEFGQKWRYDALKACIGQK